MRQTLIMATLADNRATETFVDSMRRDGINGVRINSAHVEPSTLTQMVRTVRNVDPDIKILMDTKGPEVRTTDVDTLIKFIPGDLTTLRSTDSNRLTTHESIFTPVADIERYISVGEHVLIDDGAIDAEVIEVDNTEVRLKIVRGGVLDSRKTIALSSGVIPPLPPVSRRDRTMIEAAMKAGIDMIAHSFVRSANDIRAVAEIIKDSGIQLFAKIECRQAIDRVDEIAACCDGLLCARGDLATSIGISEIPAAQFHIMGACNRAGKASIVATQILESMHTNPMPTRAEVSDIALAVMEGADWLLLCGETARGEYPIEAVEIMDRTIKSIESNHLRCKINLTNT
ncbi:MAG: pyruvate kinase [Bacteroides sp.]|nr:pyruvate kinase [Bacteroides sp.]MCM1413817.1 pyruvate kinase [Bacteroides sp.]MCM1471239.1 pyruvate kinase [Bacteroides sp.]